MLYQGGTFSSFFVYEIQIFLVHRNDVQDLPILPSGRQLAEVTLLWFQDRIQIIYFL